MTCTYTDIFDNLVKKIEYRAGNAQKSVNLFC